MAKVGLNSIIDKSFINSFLGVTKGKSSATSLANAINGGGSNKVTFSDGLRTGARAFGTAVQNLNSLTNYVGVSQQTLSQLSRLTDDMIGLAEKATRSSTGVTTRKKLVTEFQDLSRDFKNIIKDAKIGERELLNAGDLEDLFVTLGLDRKTSASVSELFGQFLFEGDEDKLVSENVAGKGFMKIPASAFSGPKKRITVGAFVEEQETTSAPADAAITATGSVSRSGTTATFNESGASTDVEQVDAIMGTDPFSAYSVIASRADYLGYNTSGAQQLYLFSAAGEALQQLTGNQDQAATFTSADVSADGTMVAFTSRSGANQTVATRAIASLGTDPATATERTYEQSSANYSAIRLSADGSHVAYNEVSTAGDSRVVLRDVATGERNNSLYQQVNLNIEFDFIDSNQLLLNRQSGSRHDLVAFSADSSSAVLVSNLESVRGLTTVEKSLTSNGSYYFSYINDEEEEIALYREGRGLVARTQFDGESVQSVSLATTAEGNEAVTIGIKGTRPADSGDADSELYRLRENGNQTLEVKTRLAAATQATGDILNSAFKLMRKPDAYRLLHDLHALKDQIETNFGALESARAMILDNIELVRSAGFAFLELSDQIGSEEEADAVARKLRKQIRSAPRKALAQAENLEGIAVAALTLDEDAIGLDS